MLRQILLAHLFIWLSACAMIPIPGHAKPTAPVTIQYEQTRSPDDAINQLTLKFTATQSLSALQVVIKPSQTIEIIDGTLNHVFPATQVGATLSIPLSIRVVKNGTGYLSIFATTSTDVGNQTRSAKLRLGERTTTPAQGNLKPFPTTHSENETTIRMQGDRR